MLHWIYYLLLLLILAAGLLATILGLPGLWLMVGAAAIYAWITGLGVYIGWPSLIALIALSVFAEIGEFVAGSAGAKQAGGSRRAMVGGIVGALLGGIFLSFIPIPIVSTLIGVCLGAFIGAAAMELTARQDVAHSFRVGAGAAKGRFYGIMVKLCIGVVMLFVAMWAALPLGGATTKPARTVASPTTVMTTAPG